MTDQEFIRQFEQGTLDPEQFHHGEHVRLVWLYLERYPVIETLSKFCSGLQRFAASLGKANLYHETITCAYVFLIHERRARMRGPASWTEFAAANADLLDWQENILKKYYHAETLQTDLARRIFVLPDKLCAPRLSVPPDGA